MAKRRESTRDPKQTQTAIRPAPPPPPVEEEEERTEEVDLSLLGADEERLLELEQYDAELTTSADEEEQEEEADDELGDVDALVDLLDDDDGSSVHGRAPGRQHKWKVRAAGSDESAYSGDDDRAGDEDAEGDEERTLAAEEPSGDDAQDERTSDSDEDDRTSNFEDDEPQSSSVDDAEADRGARKRRKADPDERASDLASEGGDDDASTLAGDAGEDDESVLADDDLADDGDDDLADDGDDDLADDGDDDLADDGDDELADDGDDELADDGDDELADDGDDELADDGDDDLADDGDDELADDGDDELAERGDDDLADDGDDDLADDGGDELADDELADDGDDDLVDDRGDASTRNDGADDLADSSLGEASNDDMADASSDDHGPSLAADEGGDLAAHGPDHDAIRADAAADPTDACEDEFSGRGDRDSQTETPSALGAPDTPWADDVETTAIRATALGRAKLVEALGSLAPRQDALAGIVLAAGLGDRLERSAKGVSLRPGTHDFKLAVLLLRTLRDAAKERLGLEGAMGLLAERLVIWSKDPEGDLGAPDGACLAACRALQAGVHWSVAGPQSADGREPLLRAVSVGLIHAAEPARAERWAIAQSQLTHRAPAAIAACAAVAVGVARLLRGEDTRIALSEMVAAACRHNPGTAARMANALEAAHTLLDPELALHQLSGPSAESTLAAAMYVVGRHGDDLAEALLEAAGAPTRGVASLVGGLLGARCGARALPAAWLEELEECDELARLALQA